MILPLKVVQVRRIVQSKHLDLRQKLYDYTDPSTWKTVQDRLQLRFSLVGGMFEYNMEQAVSAGSQLMTLPLEEIGEKEGEMEDSTEHIDQVVPVIQVVQVVT